MHAVSRGRGFKVWEVSSFVQAELTVVGLAGRRWESEVDCRFQWFRRTEGFVMKLLPCRAQLHEPRACPRAKK